MKQFKIRASGSGQIMTGNFGLSLSEKNKMLDLESRKNGTHIKKLKLTDKMQLDLDCLIKKKENPELSKTAKTFCENWLKEQLYNRRKQFSSKQTEKGTKNEDLSIDLLIKNGDIGIFAEKNEEYFEDDFFTGTPDILLKDTVIDLKNSFDAFTFPLFESKIPNEDYFYQLQIYMYLTKTNNAELIYTLTNTPEEIVDKEIHFATIDKGYNKVEYEAVENIIMNYHNYDNIPANLRIKIFKFKFDDNIINDLKERVIACRKYINKLNTLK